MPPLFDIFSRLHAESHRGMHASEEAVEERSDGSRRLHHLVDHGAIGSVEDTVAPANIASFPVHIPSYPKLALRHIGPVGLAADFMELTRRP